MFLLRPYYRRHTPRSKPGVLGELGLGEAYRRASGPLHLLRDGWSNVWSWGGVPARVHSLWPPTPQSLENSYPLRFGNIWSCVLHSSHAPGGGSFGCYTPFTASHQGVWCPLSITSCSCDTVITPLGTQVHRVLGIVLTFRSCG